MERVDADDRVGGSFSDDGADPFGPVAGHEPQLTGPSRAERVEEAGHNRLGAALASPDHLAGEVIAHDRQVLVAFLVLDLVDRDRDEPVQHVDPPERLSRDPDTHGVDRPPGDPVPVSGSLGVADNSVVDDEVLERPSEHRIMPRPRHQCDRRAVGGAVHPASYPDQLACCVTDIDMPPTAAAATLVVERRFYPAPSAPATTTGLGPHRHFHQRSSTIAFHQHPTHDHRGTTQPERCNEYLLEPHAADPPSESDRRTARNVR